MDGLTQPQDIDGPDNDNTRRAAANDTPPVSRLEPLAPPGPGAVLRAERESRGYSIDDVAEALKLAPRQVEAIEADDFDALRGQTFARGFVKNYARLLQLDPEPLVARIQSSAPPMRVAIEPRSNARTEMPIAGGSQGPVVAGGLAVLALVVVAVAGTAGDWLSPRATDAKNPAAPLAAPAVSATSFPAPSSATDNTPPAVSVLAPSAPVAESSSGVKAETPAASAVVSSPEPSKTAAAAVTPVAASSTNPAQPPLSAKPAPANPASAEGVAVKPAPAKTAPAVVSYALAASATPTATHRPGELAMTTVVAPLPGAKAEAPAVASSARGSKRLVFNFDQEAWVEVKDAEGKVVFSQLSPAGASRSVSGKAPLSFVVGNAHHVKLRVDDQPFDLKPHIGVTVARFSVQ
jgi:cytoskeleton protein RodZ